MPDRERPPSLWGDWTPEDESAPPWAAPRRRALPTPPPPPREEPRAEPPPPPAEPRGTTAVTWSLGIAGLALATTIGIGLLLALVSADSWLLGFVGTDAGIVVETARQSIEVPFGALFLSEGGDPFVYGLILPAVLVAATAASAARHLPAPEVDGGRRRLLAASAAIPYVLSMSVVAAVASEGPDVSVSGTRLVFWGAVLVGGGAALGAVPLAPGAWPRARALSRAALGPMAQAWAVLSIVLTVWLVGLTATQQGMRIGYDVGESARQIPGAERVGELRLSPAPALSILATIPANLGFAGIASGMLSQEEGIAPLGATDGAVDALPRPERRRFVACSLGLEEDACPDVRIFDAPDTLPTTLGLFMALLVMTTSILAAAVAGHRLAALAPDDGTLRALHGALVGPVWAMVLVLVDAVTDSNLDGWSTFTSVLLIGTLSGLAGAAVLHDQRTGEPEPA